MYRRPAYGAPIGTSGPGGGRAADDLAAALLSLSVPRTPALQYRRSVSAGRAPGPGLLKTGALPCAGASRWATAGVSPGARRVARVYPVARYRPAAALCGPLCII